MEKTAGKKKWVDNLTNSFKEKEAGPFKRKDLLAQQKSNNKKSTTHNGGKRKGGEEKK